MKINKIYIENFGCLHQYEKSFTSKINSIEEKNGFGKTTIANFIKAMFYGFTNSKKNINDNDRIHYAPWQGGIFGGNLEFEHKGKIYKIERFFGETSSVKDTFKLYDLSTKKISSDYTKNIGEEIFKVDVDGFIRSAYMPQINLDWTNNNKISQNLINLLEESSDINNFEKSIKKLENESKKYVKVGNKGLIKETEDSIDEYEIELERCSLAVDNRGTLLKKQDELENILKEKKQALIKIKEEIKIANRQNESIAIRNHYESLLNSFNDSKNEVEQLLELFKNKIPTKEEIDYYNALLELITQLQTQLSKTNNDQFFLDEYEKLEKYCLVSTDKELNDELINEQIKNNEKFKKLSIESQSLFAKIDNLDNMIKNEILFTQPHKMSHIVLFVLGLTFIIAGLGIFVLSIINNTWILIALSVFALIVGIVIMQMGKSNKKHVKNKELMEDYQKEKNTLLISYKQMKKEIEHLESEIKQFIFLYKNNIDEGQFSKLIADEDFTSELQIIKTNYDTYLKYKKRNVEILEQTNELSCKYEKFNQEINSFISFYDINVEPYQAIKIIQSNYEKYLILNDQYAQRLKALKDFIKENPKCEEYSELTYDLHKLEIDENDLENSIDEINKNLLDLKDNIKKNNDLIIEITSLESEIEIKKELLKEYNKNYYLLTKTIEFLNIAKDKHSSNYLELIQLNFSKYLNLVLEKNNKFELDADFKISSIEYGMAKDLDYFSAGYKDIIVFCARLALLEALFQDCLPPIILDDPFVNCDNNKFEIAKNMLNMISDKYQIIYLFCHTSRKVE